MKQENFDMSEEKWRALKELFDKPGRVDWENVDAILEGACGHCKEYAHTFGGGGCGTCPLYIPDICYNPTGYFTLRDMVDYFTKRNKRKAKRIVNRIYKAILKDDPRR
jgi:hypothetical protein